MHPIVSFLLMLSILAEFGVLMYFYCLFIGWLTDRTLIWLAKL